MKRVPLTSGSDDITGAGTFLGAVTAVLEQAINRAGFPEYETARVLTETPFFGFGDLEHVDVTVGGRTYRLRAEEVI